MTRRDLLDIESQVADANRADRDAHNATRHARDRDDYTWINGHAYDQLDGPDTADKWED